MNLNSLATLLRMAQYIHGCMYCAVLNQQLRSPLHVASEKSTARKKVIMTTIEQLAGITAQHNEIVKRIINGSLDPSAVKRALQNIVEGKLPTPTWNPPTWWRAPEQQLARARQLWPNTALPEPPAEFTPQTKSEVLLLHVPGSFNSLWSKVVAPEGYAKCRLEEVKASKRNLRLAPNKVEYTQPVWLAFDPEHGSSAYPSFFWGQADIAASEVLSALIQFPDWSLTWHSHTGSPASAPNLSGYQLKDDDGWTSVPCLLRWGGHELRLGARQAIYGYNLQASPSVREC